MACRRECGERTEASGDEKHQCAQQKNAMRRLASRNEAGKALAARLATYAGRSDLVVLALPRGGVPMGYEIARALQAQLELFFVRKVGVPQYPELAMGAVASGGAQKLDEAMIREFRLSQAEVAAAVARSRNGMERQEEIFREGRTATELKGKTVILTDDGIATGHTMRVAIEAVRQLGAERVIVATGVAPPSTVKMIRAEADEVVCLLEPRDFRAVGSFYEDFSQVPDNEVKRMLASTSVAEKETQE